MYDLPTTSIFFMKVVIIIDDIIFLCFFLFYIQFTYKNKEKKVINNSVDFHKKMEVVGKWYLTTTTYPFLVKEFENYTW
jgi:hypothetical protein